MTNDAVSPGSRAQTNSISEGADAYTNRHTSQGVKGQYSQERRISLSSIPELSEDEYGHILLASDLAPSDSDSDTFRAGDNYCTSNVRPPLRHRFQAPRSLAEVLQTAVLGPDDRLARKLTGVGPLPPDLEIVVPSALDHRPSRPEDKFQKFFSKYHGPRLAQYSLANVPIELMPNDMILDPEVVGFASMCTVGKGNRSGGWLIRNVTGGSN